MITVKVDVTKLDKARFFVGKKGTYCDLVLIETPDDQYGNDYLVKQGVSQEERQSGVKMPIIGNAKDHAKANAKPKSRPEPAPAGLTEDDEIPF
jgi:hypothetical protein